MKASIDWRKYAPFVWHGFFLALTMAMLDLNTVLPSLLSSLTSNIVLVGAIFSLMLGAPLLFNLPFSRFQNRFTHRRPFLLVGIYLRSFSFLGLAFAILWWGKDQPMLALGVSAFFILLFSVSGGFAGIAYTELVGRIFEKEQRGSMYATRQVFSGIAALLGGAFLVWLFQPGNQAFPLNYAIGLFIGAAGLMLGAIGFWKLREPLVPLTARVSGVSQEKSRSSLAILKKDPALLRFILVENLSGFSVMLLPFYMLFIKSSFSDFGAWVGLFVIAQTIGAIVSNFMWAWIFKRAGARTVTRLCMISGGLIPLIALLIQPWGIPAYTGLFFIIGFVISGRNIGFEPWLLEIAPTQERTIYLGIRGSLSLLIAFLPLAGGLVIQSLGFTNTFIAVAILMLASAWLVPGRRSSQGVNS